jgi:hypothetical protein
MINSSMCRALSKILVEKEWIKALFATHCRMCHNDNVLPWGRVARHASVKARTQQTGLFEFALLILRNHR